jgi:predicted transglutaminase-like cysteine proteinase
MYRESKAAGQPHSQKHFGPKGILNQIKTFLDRNRLGELLVIKGLITTNELRFALSEHKRTAQPLGQVMLKHAMVSRRQLNGLLIRQSVLRCLATTLMVLMAFSSFGKRARADIIKDVPASIAFNVAATTAGPIEAYPRLFGSTEKRSGNLSAFTKWSGMFSRLDRQLQTESGKQTIATMQARLQAFEGGSLKTMASQVNSMMNEKPYILDNKNWGQSDYWETVVDFMSKGGDCEDFAIAKYTALRALGVPEERMRVAIVQDLVKNIPHAVLVVYAEDGPVILDNQNKSLVDGADAGRYKPIFSINREAWWLHTAPDGTQIASR